MRANSEDLVPLRVGELHGAEYLSGERTGAVVALGAAHYLGDPYQPIGEDPQTHAVTEWLAPLRIREQRVRE